MTNARIIFFKIKLADRKETEAAKASVQIKEKEDHFVNVKRQNRYKENNYKYLQSTIRQLHNNSSPGTVPLMQIRGTT